jgi:dynein heavy chain
LLGDLFPGLTIPRKRDMEFEKIIEEVSIESKLNPAPEFIEKIV